MSNFQHESPEPASIPLTSNFHAGQMDGKSNFHSGQSNFHVGEIGHAGMGENFGKESNFHAGNFHVGQLNSDAAENFHVGQIDAKSNFHAGNFHAGAKLHSGNFHAGDRGENFHAGNFHAGNFHAGNFHAGNFHAGKRTEGENFHAGNFHAGNFHAGNFHAGDLPKTLDSNTGSNTEKNFHAGNFHAGDKGENFHRGNFHAGNFHAGDKGENFHAGKRAERENFHAGNFHAGNFHAGDKGENFHRGNFHAGNFHAGDKGENFHAGNFHAGKKENFHAGNFHAGDPSKTADMGAGPNAKENFHAGFSKPSSQAEYDISNIINFHAGQSSALATGRQTIQSQPVLPRIETSLSFYASTFDGKPGFNYVEKPADGVYSNVTTSSHKLSVTDLRGAEDQLNLERDAVLTISNIPDHGHTFTDDATVTKDFYPQVEQLLLQHVPGAHRVFIFDHTIRRKFGDRGPVLRAHIDQTPASALARVTRHLPDEAATLTKGRVRLINFWRPINGTVENCPLAFALSGSVPDTALEPVKHHYPTWTGETYGVGYTEGQNWCYWSKMGNSDALLLQCFDSEKGGRLVHSAVMDPTSTSQKYRESIEVRALVFG